MLTSPRSFLESTPPLYRICPFVNWCASTATSASPAFSRSSPVRKLLVPVSSLSKPPAPQALPNRCRQRIPPTFRALLVIITCKSKHGAERLSSLVIHQDARCLLSSPVQFPTRLVASQVAKRLSPPAFPNQCLCS